jgi:hypothetical protein
MAQATEVGVGTVVEALSARVRAARAGVSAAMAAEDPYAVAVAQDELDDALRVALRHGIDVEGERADEE